MSDPDTTRCGPVAQQVEQRLRNPPVAGSIPVGASIIDCYDCKLPIIPWQVVWLGDEWGGRFPFHARCANQPWPLFECSALDG